MSNHLALAARAAGGVLLTLLVGFGATAQANEIAVSGLVDDANGALPGCSLREAIRSANGNQAADCDAAGADDVLLLTAGTHQLGIPGASENSGLTGDLDVHSTVTIRPAPGTGLVEIDGADLDLVLQVHSGAELTLERITVSGGLAGSGGGVNLPPGGGTAHLIDAVLTGNEANSNGGGGGAYVGSGSTLSILRTVFAGNHATAGRTGGLLVESGTVDARDSAFIANTTTSSGGAVHASGFSGSQTFENVLFTRNQATSGGALGFDGAKDVTITQSTIAGNAATSSGGGIQSINSDNELAIGGSVIARNTATTSGPDCRAAGAGNVSLGRNLIGDGTDCTAMPPGPGDLIGTAAAAINPRLLAPADNGGPVPTRALRPNSPLATSCRRTRRSASPPTPGARRAPAAATPAPMNTCPAAAGP